MLAPGAPPFTASLMEATRLVRMIEESKRAAANCHL
jgi:hypothetical protein